MLNDNKLCEESKKMILLVFNDTTTTNKKVQFLLDCSTLPEVIAEVQNKSDILVDLFKFSRSWCYSINKSRLKLIGRWNKQFYS